MNQELEINSNSGFLMLFVLFIAQIATIAGVFFLPPIPLVIDGLLGFAVLICWWGFYLVQPNQGKVIQLFGRYVGTDRNNGLRWANPFYSRQAVSLRVRNFESSRLKVNDANGNPIEIAAVIVW